MFAAANGSSGTLAAAEAGGEEEAEAGPQVGGQAGLSGQTLAGIAPVSQHLSVAQTPMALMLSASSLAHLHAACPALSCPVLPRT
jgi:hypothetical protein